jgi:hypothetical protein
MVISVFLCAPITVLADTSSNQTNVVEDGVITTKMEYPPLIAGEKQTAFEYPQSVNSSSLEVYLEKYVNLSKFTDYLISKFAICIIHSLFSFVNTYNRF